MTKSTITREQQRQILIDTAQHIISRDNTSPYSENLREIARIALAAIDSEPVAYMHHSGQVITREECCDDKTFAICCKVETPLYRHAQPAPEKYNIGDTTMRHIFTPTGMTNVSNMQAVFDRVEAVLVGMEQPAPVSVPDAMEMDDDFDSAFEHGKAVGWNACRAAILQRAEPVQGWIPCSDRMPTKNHRVLIFINFNSDTVPPSIHDAQFTGSTFRRGNATVNVFPLEDGYGVTHWMPLPAAPQEDKP